MSQRKRIQRKTSPRKRSQRRSSFFAAILAAAALALAGCSRLPVYSHFEAVDSDGWQRGDTLRFVIPVDSGGIHPLTFSLRTTSYYPYTRLTLLLRRYVHSSGLTQTDTLRFNITDPQGIVHAPGVSIFQFEAPLPPAHLVKGDTLSLAVVHNMSIEWLPGVSDVGITVQ